MNRKPKTGEFYRHFKNKLYQIIAVAVHTETGEEMVVYQALYGTYSIYVRPLAMFAGEVDREKYPEVSQKYRFEPVNLKAGESENTDCLCEDLPEEPIPEESRILDFLEADGIRDKLSVLHKYNGKFTKEELDNICEVLDIHDPAYTVEETYHAVERYLMIQAKYDGTRLR